MWKPPELSVSGGFFLIVGWFAVSCGGEAALLVLSAALLHELGHILALRLSGAGICWLRISVLGAIMETRGNLSYGQELLYLLLSWLAGPQAAFWGSRCIGCAAAAAVCCLAVWLMWQTGGSLWLLPAALGLLAASIGGQRQGRTF